MRRTDDQGKEFQSDTFKSPLLKSQCGFEVTLSFTGSVTVKTFPNRPVGPQDLTLVIFAVVFSANNKPVRFQQVQATITQVKPEVSSDVVATAIFAGKTVEFTGVQKINLTTGVTTLQSHNVSDAARDVICERLKA